MRMSLEKKAAILWDKAFWNAIGCGHTVEQAEDFAREKTAAMRALLRSAERRQAHPNGHPRPGCRAGRLQRAIAEEARRA